jgi:hypothetical protein
MIHVMSAKFQKGGLAEGFLIVLGLAIVLFVILGHTGVPGTNTPISLFNTAPTNSSGLGSISGTPTTAQKTSPYANGVQVGSGNASSATEPYQEYVTIRNNSNASVDITGWSLSNARGSRVYSVGSNEEQFPSDVVVIPQGTALISSTPSTPQDIVLKSGESADIITGSIGTSYPYKITTFKENECTNYLTSGTDNYTFTPYIQDSCVSPQNEVGADGLDMQCQNYIESMQSCHTPKYNTVDSQGNTCNGCVDGTPVSSSCLFYIQSHFSYEACLVNHQNDPNFYGTVWHIYLGRTFELWAVNHETISLYDSSGKLVDDISY